MLRKWAGIVSALNVYERSIALTGEILAKPRCSRRTHLSTGEAEMKSQMMACPWRANHQA